MPIATGSMLASDLSRHSTSVEAISALDRKGAGPGRLVSVNAHVGASELPMLLTEGKRKVNPDVGLLKKFAFSKHCMKAIICGGV